MIRLQRLVLLVASVLALARGDPGHAAACLTATAECGEWVRVGGGPQRSLVYRTHALQARNENVQRALILVHGQARASRSAYRTALAAASLAGVLDDTIVIAPEQQKVIHEYVVKQNTAPVVLPSDTTVEVGTVVPDSVEIHTLDVPDMQTRYDYMVVNGQTVLVDPQSRKIVEVLH